jgi:outer membrane protein assembly factor BamB
VVSNRVYLTGDVGTELHIFALDQSGKRIWTATNGLAWSNDYPGARSSVTFNDGRLYHENSHGVLFCLDAATGRKIWSVDLLKDYRGKNITWGLSECVLVDERAVYATVGGEKTSVVAFDKVLGPEKVLWQSERVGESSPSYVSPIMATVKGRRYVIGCTLRDLFCMEADTGKVVGTRPFPTSYSVLAMMPTIANDSVFMTAPHGKGGFLLKIPNQTS